MTAPTQPRDNPVSPLAAVIAEISTHSVRAGYAGDARPIVCHDSSVGYGRGSVPELVSISEGGLFPNDPNVIRQDTDICRPIVYDNSLKLSSIVDLEAFQRVVGLSLAPLGISSKGRPSRAIADVPVLVVEPSLSTKEFRKAWLTELFDKLDTSAVFFAREPVLSAFACGRTSAVVLDAGCSRITCSVVAEGYRIPKSSIDVPIGGHLLSQTLSQYLASSSKGGGGSPRVSIEPFFFYDKEAGRVAKRPFVRESYMQWGRLAVVDDIKTTSCSCRPLRAKSSSKSDTEASNSRDYSLPDGTVVAVSSFRTALPELILSGLPRAKTLPPLLQLGLSAEALEALTDYTSEGSLPGLIRQSISNSELLGSGVSGKQKEALNALVVSGGSTAFPNFLERLEGVKDELSSGGSQSPQQQALLTPSNLRVLAPPSPECRAYGPFLGASILSSLGSFKSFAVQRSEYLESGAAVFEKRCP